MQLILVYFVCFVFLFYFFALLLFLFGHILCFLYFCPSLTTWVQILSLPSLPLVLKSKMAAMIYAEKIVSIKSPKLRLSCLAGYDLSRDHPLIADSSALLLAFKYS